MKDIPVVDRSAAVRAVLVIVLILILTVLEFPAPIGFETRPQADVSMLWLILFLAIVIVEIAAIPLLLRRAALGPTFGIVAGLLNIMQVIADQAHLMQPEVAPLGYSLLEGLVALASVALIFFCWQARLPVAERA